MTNLSFFGPSRRLTHWLRPALRGVLLLLVLLGAAGAAQAMSPLARVDAITPDKGTVGTQITISGLDLDNAGGVRFGSSVYVPKAGFVSISGDNTDNGSASSITLTVPVGTRTEQLRVEWENSGLTGPVFTVVPALSSVSPNPAAPGSVVTLSGTGLIDITGVSFNGTAATAFTYNSFGDGTTFTATVPAGATSGPVTVTTLGGTSNGVDLLIKANAGPTALALSNSSVAENTSANAFVGSFSTTDPDAGNTFTYSLVSGSGDTDNARFTISGTTLRLIAPADFETKNTYTVRVRTTDQGGLSFEQDFPISVTDANDAPTALALSNSSVAENAGANAVVGTFSTTDPDANNTFTYTLITGSGSPESARFNITNVSGTSTLRLTASADFETKSSYSIRVRTRDQSGDVFTQVFTISVINVNEAAPSLSAATRTVAENSANGTNVGEPVTGTDADAGTTLTYSITAGNTGGAFAIDATTGQLTVAGALDFEATNSYALTVQASDGTLTASNTVTVTVTNVNDAPTALALSNSSVAENAGPDAEVGTFSTTDPDASNTFTYALVAGAGDADNGSFSISGSSLRLAASADFETKSDYIIRVQATDQDGLSFEKAFALSITDVNEAPTLAGLSPTSGPAGTEVTLTGTNFTGATDVRFNGTPTSVTVLDATTATATVPEGATTGNVTITTPDGTSNGLAFEVTALPTTVTSIVPAGSGLTNAASVNYTVTFAEPVTGLTEDNFSLTATGDVAGASVSSVSGSGSTYTVTVSTGSGDGTLRLNLANATGISPSVSNSPYTSDTAYLLDKTAPTASIASGTADANGTSSSPVFEYTVTFSEAVSGFTADGVLVGNGSISNFGGGGIFYTFNVTPAGNGPVLVSVLPGATDAAGNGNEQPAFYVITYAQPVTAAPVVTAPANGSLIQNPTPTYSGTAVASSTVEVFVDGSSIGTTTATDEGTFSLTQPTALSYADHTVYATAQASGAAVSEASAPNTFTVTVAEQDLVVRSGDSKYIDTNTPAAERSYRNITVEDGAYLWVARTTLSASRTVLIASGGSLRLDRGATLDGAASFTLKTNTSLLLDDLNGISATGATGAIRTTGARFFSPGASYIYFSFTDGGTGQAGTGLPARVQNLVVQNATRNLSQPLAIRGFLSLQGYGLTFSPGATLTLLADADSTATLDYDSRFDYSSLGALTVQRYVSGAPQGYRHLSAPVTTATIGSLAIAGGFQPVVNPAFNSAERPGTVRPFPTVQRYNEQRLQDAGVRANNYAPFTKGWESPAALTDAMTSGRGYTAQMAAGQTLAFTGPVAFGVVSVPLTRGASTVGLMGSTTDAAGWNLVGNPFAASFDLNKLTPNPFDSESPNQNIDAAKYVFEATGPYAGTYRTFLPAPTLGGGGAIGEPLVALGQAFFVRVTQPSSTATLVIDRYADTGEASRGSVVETRPLLALSISNAAGTMRDQTTLYQAGMATAGLDAQYDATKLANPSGLSLSQSAAGTELAINGLPAFTSATVVPLNVQVPAAGTYALQVERLLNLPAGTTATLVDTETGARHSLASLPAAGYSFSTTSAKTLSSRFTLNLTAAGPLASAPALRAESISLAPNPAHGRTTVLIPAVAGIIQVHLSLHDALGRTLRAHTAALPVAGLRHELDLTGLAPGVYLLQVQAGTATVTRRLLVN